MCEESIVIPSGSLSIISFDITQGVIEVVDCFDRCIFVPDSAITSRLILVGLGEV